MSLLKRFARVLCTTLLCMAMVNNAMAAVVTYYHNDISGSPIAATDAAGNLKWKESYKPYGDKLTRSAASSDNKIGFHGKAHDDSTGLSYMGARYYDPVLARFIGVDPEGFNPGSLHSFNRYTYANNNPYRFVDPDGHSPIDIAFLVYDLGRLGLALYTGQGVGAAAADVAISVVGVASPIPGSGRYMQGVLKGGERAIESAQTGSRVGELSAKAEGKSGEFSISDWSGYPEGATRPNGPFRLLEGKEYAEARKAANSANGKIRRNEGLVGKPVDVHEVHPVKFGGSPTDRANKEVLGRKEHQETTSFWNKLQKDITK
ncbi:RHS repeat domain-containing protein [Pseudomonas monteilii]|uniref:RHS repeat domain-containing protein n=1 Tax=Pseudomonas monteilii TaxID=76759 RepID=UPI0037FBEBB6